MIEVIRMPHIRPIRDLRDTTAISELCHSTDEPIFITKNGHGDLVVMSMEAYDRRIALVDMQQKIEQAERDFAEGKGIDGREVFKKLREKYGYKSI